jgi:hypothetical protein
VPGIGESGQEAIGRARVRIEGSGLAAEVCALYLAGAGVRALEVDSRIADACRALNREVEVIVGLWEPTERLLAWVLGERFVTPDAASKEDPVLAGATAARWVLARILDARASPPPAPLPRERGVD